MSFEFNAKSEKCLMELKTRFKHLDMNIIGYTAQKHNYDVHQAAYSLNCLGDLVEYNRARCPRIPDSDQYVSTSAIEECIDDVQTGARVLILLRGLPGSGKSYLAKSILKACYPDPNYRDHIHSSDYFFMHNGKYLYDHTRISEAHEWNQKNVDLKMQRAYSPLIVDNTNTQMWEMSAYASLAIRHGYKIHVVEMNTKWCFNCNELTKRNQHNVPKDKIKSMLERYEKGITADSLIKFRSGSCVYQQCPLRRSYPPFGEPKGILPTNPDLSLPKSKKKDREPDDEGGTSKINGSAGTSPTKASEGNILRNRAESTDWSKLISFAWGTPTKNGKDSPKCEVGTSCSSSVKPTTSEVGTNVSLMDFHQDTGDKVLYGNNRDINDFCKPLVSTKPGMFNKGCSTDDLKCTDKNEDLKKLIDIFKKVPPTFIKDVYEGCQCDFDMTFEIFLEDNKDYSDLPFDSNDVFGNANDLQKAEVERELTSDESEESLSWTCTTPEETPKKVEKALEFVSKGPSHCTGAIKKGSKPRCPSTSESDNEEVSATDSESEQTSGTPPEYDNVELNLGNFLVKQLEKQFGDCSHKFPDGFQPIVQVPKDMARQLYAFYVESIYQQMDTQKAILDKLVKEDEAFARKLQEEEIGVVQKPRPEEFQDIMNEQAALKKLRDQMPKLETPNDIATLLTKKKLFERFPSVQQEVILEIYHANSFDYQKTVDDLINSVGFVGDQESVRKPPISQKALEELEKAQKDSKPKDKEEETKSPEEYREEAEYYLRKRNELYQKAQEQYSKGQMEVAQFYSQLAQHQTQYYDIANNKAATVFLHENAKNVQDPNTLDLHYLYVKEAVAALDVFIDRRINSLQGKGKIAQDLLIITGRGRRSANGVSKIRPAVIKRLEARNIKHRRINPGLLKIKIRVDTPVTNNL